jgi:uncharacterized membrane protein
MNLFPMHSWHPVAVHLPLVALVLAAAFDLGALRKQSPRWRDAATVLWWLGLLGAATAIATGLLAYNRVEHSDLAHQAMTLHRNLALAAVAILLLAALWRWRRPFSRGAAILALAGGGGGGGGATPRWGTRVSPRHRHPDRDTGAGDGRTRRAFAFGRGWRAA